MELQTIRRASENRKTQGLGGIMLESNGTPNTIKRRVLNIVCGRLHQLPKEWKGRLGCNNYKSIRLISAAYKVYIKVITRHPNAITEVLLNEEYGLRKGRSCSDSICMLHQTL
jgi:hypothetical protein